MNKENVRLIILTTMEEIVLDPEERTKIAGKLETARHEIYSRQADRQEFLLTAILYFTIGIAVCLLCLGAQMPSLPPNHQGDAPSATAKPWWEQLFEKPAPKAAQ